MNAIQPHELMVGNWVLGEDGTPAKIAQIVPSLWIIEPPMPIPLTPEILDKIKEANGEEFSFEWTKELGLYWDVWDGIHLEHIQHVHQFQNFYYMAENKELIVEL